MNKKEKMQNKVNKHFLKEKIEILSSDGSKGLTVAKCKTCGQIYSFNYGENLISKNKKVFCRKCFYAEEKKNKFQNDINKNYPFDNLEVISFSNKSEPAKIKCLTCGTVHEFKKGSSVEKKTTTYFCRKCFPAKEKQRKQAILKFKEYLQRNNQWELISNLEKVKRTNELITCKCCICGKNNQRTMADYLRGRGCECQNPAKPIREEDFINNMEDGYSLLSLYNGIYGKVTIRHDICGFIYKTTARNVWRGRGKCPKCSKKESKGEKIIQSILDEKSIKYFREYPINIKGHNLHFDFFLPEQNLYIEFQGIQHFQAVPYFGGEQRLQKQQEFDQLKRQWCNDRLIEIRYDIPLEELKQSLTQRLS